MRPECAFGAARTLRGVLLLLVPPFLIGERSCSELRSSDRRVCFVADLGGDATEAGRLPTGVEAGCACCSIKLISNNLVSCLSADFCRAGLGPRPISISCSRKACSFEIRGMSEQHLQDADRMPADADCVRFSVFSSVIEVRFHIRVSTLCEHMHPPRPGPGHVNVLWTLSRRRRAFPES